MLVYYLGLFFIFSLFLGCLLIFIEYKKYTKLQLSFITSMSFIAMTVMGVGYYRYGALQELQSVYAYREIQFLLSDLQKNSKASSVEIEKSLSDLYQHLPQIELVHSKMGEVFLAANCPIQAEKAYAAALKINTTNREYRYGFYYAQSLRYQGILPSSTERELTNLVLQYPKDNGFLNLLAVNSFQTKRYEKAIDYWKKIESNNPEEMSLIQQMIVQAQSQLDQAT